ncbi:MAG: nucleoside hydrolase, partial [Clostridia bacterium]|nr:nucleoside hydrolase [Clostridia bacterium]
KIHMVLDTDTKNDVDDQFALTYACRLHDEGAVSLDAVYAAPFTHEPSPSAGEGMEQSYEEIIRILDLIGIKETEDFVFRGSDRFLDGKAVDSPAAKDLVKRAMTFTEDEPLYVVAIGAITNIASAILMQPEIINKIVVIWLGGTEIHQDFASEYNLMQDPAASRIILDCGVPLVQLPCKGVVDKFTTTVSELERFIDGKTEIGTYLTSLVRECDNGKASSRVIWDVTAVGYAVHPDWFESALYHTPLLTEGPPGSDSFRVLDCYKDGDGGLFWSHDSERHFMRAVTEINRDRLFYDLFVKINME